MNEALAYILKSVCYSGILLVYYWLFLRNKRLHVFNRWYLLSATVLSLVLPLMHFNLPGLHLPHNVSAYQLLDVVQGKGEEELIVQKAVSILTWQNTLKVLYLMLVGFMAVMLSLQLLWLHKLKRRGVQSLQNGYLLVITDSSKAPFSFFNLLFWNSSMDMGTEEGKRILQHELLHIRQWHTLDKLLLQSVLMFFWFNPFYWLLQKELSLVHEFIADEGAIENRDTELFARMLLQEYCGKMYPDIVLPFFSSTKRRLFMLTQSNKPRFATMRRLMVLPLLGATVFLFSFRSGNPPVSRAQQTIRLALDAGHGGEDNGATGVDGAKEKDLTLRISKRLAQMAEAYNIKVISMRREDEFVSLPDRSATANTADANMLLSIHLNASPEFKQQQTNRPKGFDIVLQKQNAESRALGSAVAAQLKTMEIPTRLVDRNLVLLRNSKMPAILIECGYIDQESDVARITSPEQLDKLCSSILEGLVLYQNSKK